MNISNPNRSGGPRTPEGKSISSRNSLKAGAYSTRLILPGEQVSDYESLLEQFQSDFAPKDIAEQMMVGELAQLTWKQMRFDKFGHTLLINAMSPAVAPGEFQKIFPVGYTDERFECTQRIGDADFDAQVSSHRAIIPILQGLLAKPTVEGLRSFKADFPDQFNAFKSQCDSEVACRGDFEEFVLGAFRRTASFTNVSFTELFLRPQLLLASNMVWVHENRDSIEQALQAVKADRAMALLQGKLSTRVYDDLRRAFFRTLSEFRRHQVWRRAQYVVDVNIPETQPSPALRFEEVWGEQGEMTDIDLQIELIRNDPMLGQVDDRVY